MILENERPNIAVVKILPDCLYAAKFNSNELDQFASVMNQWRDVVWLRRFFEENITDLQTEFWNHISVNQAVMRTIEEADLFEQKLLSRAEKGKTLPANGIKKLFTPLHPNERYVEFPFQQTKAYGKNKNSWLRLYGIRLGTNVFLITGGAIKLTRSMNERQHLLAELTNLNHCEAFARKMNLLGSIS